MFCQYNMFDAESQVYVLQEGQDSYSIFKGNFEEQKQLIRNNGKVFLEWEAEVMVFPVGDEYAMAKVKNQIYIVTNY